MNNGNICCNEAHKAWLGGAPRVDPQELDNIMLEMESSDNFCSSVNSDHDNDVTEVYDDDDKADEEDVDHNRVGDSDNQDDDGLEHKEEVDSEVDNDDYRDYDDFWIPCFFKEECITMDTIVDIKQFDMGKMSVEDHIGRYQQLILCKLKTIEKLALDLHTCVHHLSIIVVDMTKWGLLGKIFTIKKCA
ncbi:hypothetical protein JHK87_022369 [Glycine soja]|nr:hypothetical protein JHK87_022369 [Glycine soja]